MHKLDTLKEDLKAQGWKIASKRFRPQDTGVEWEAYKPDDSLPDCLCNDKPPSVVICPWYMPADERHPEVQSCEVVIRGETNENVWVELKAYGLHPEIDDVLIGVNQVKAAWLGVMKPKE